MTPRRPYARTGLNALKARVKLRGLDAIDRRTAGARSALAFKTELVSALGGEADLSPQRRRLVDMTVRATVLLDHVDAWLFEQRSLVNQRSRTLLPVLAQRQAIADHVTRLLDKLGLDRLPVRVPPDAIAEQKEPVWRRLIEWRRLAADFGEVMADTVMASQSNAALAQEANASKPPPRRAPVRHSNPRLAETPCAKRDPVQRDEATDTR